MIGNFSDFSSFVVFYPEDQLEETGVWLQDVTKPELQQIKALLKSTLCDLEEDRAYFKYVGQNSSDKEFADSNWHRYVVTSNKIKKLSAIQTKIKRTLS